MLGSSIAKVRWVTESLQNLQGDARAEILEDAGAMDLLSQLQPKYMPGEPEPDESPPAQPSWPAGPQGTGWPAPSNPGFGDFPREEASRADWARPAQAPGSAGKNNPFKKSSAPAGADWAMPQRGEAYPAPAQGFPDAFPAFPSSAPRPTSASNPFRKEKEETSGGTGWPAVPGDLDAFQSVRPAPRPPPTDGRGHDASASAASGSLASQDVVAGARFAKESGISAQDMMAGAQFAQKSGVTSQQPG